ncbi:MAG: S41 family peptidase [Bdellovibrionaceae bacterium]|nr:S41 family peptidase [Pseudobdellovibrionaceae bacterium]
MATPKWAMLSICHLVYTRIYLQTDELSEWFHHCKEKQKDLSLFVSEKLVRESVRAELNKIPVSHLGLYEEPEVRDFWHGENRETGIRARFVDGELLITEVLPQSPADAAGIQRGDVILLQDGEHPSELSVQLLGGDLLIKRESGQRLVRIEPSRLQRDERPRVEISRQGTPILRIPSFRGEYFSSGWKHVLATVRDKLIVDLRANRGGNFVAGLRLISKLICKEVEVGAIHRPRVKTGPNVQMPDDISDIIQIRTINQSARVAMITQNLNCQRPRMVVVVDESTSSVAEMVAAALRDHGHAKIIGWRTSGTLLVSTWYDFPELGRGVKLSLPEAVYLTSKNHMIEGLGLSPDLQADWNLREAQLGLDSLIEKSDKILNSHN